MQRAVGARGELRIVGDDDEAVPTAALSSSISSNTCSAVLRSRLPVGSSASTQRGLGDQLRARAPHAGARRRRARRAGASSDGRGRRASSVAAASSCARRRRHAPDHERHRDVLHRAELRQQMVELVDEAERAIAHLAARGVGRAWRGRAVDVTSPAVGASSPPRRCSSVLLPEPEAPTMATRSPLFTDRSTPRSTGTSAGPLVYVFARPRQAITGVEGAAKGRCLEAHS